MTTPLDFTLQLARSTGEILLGFFSPTGIDSEYKANNTLVTQADLAANQHIISAIQQAYPNDLIISEEGNTTLKSLDKPVWIIDPLDGTTNFSLGLPIWGISIARIVNGIPDTSVLAFPTFGEFYTAQRGQGAQLNGNPVKASTSNTHATEAFFTCCSRTHKKYDIQIRRKTRILGAATYNLVSIARGSGVIAFESTPNIWDIAASWLIVEESGGCTGVLSGPLPFPLVSGTDYANISYPTIMAATQDLYTEAQEKITPRK